jgi:effector-binding domain-containing protein
MTEVGRNGPLFPSNSVRSIPAISLIIVGCKADIAPPGNRPSVDFHLIAESTIFGGEDEMTPFQEIKTVPPVKAIGLQADVSLWNVDTAFTRLYESAMEGKLRFHQPGFGIRRGEAGLPDPFRSDYEVCFPLDGEPRDAIPGTGIRELPAQKVASFIHRGPYHWISCTYEKVLDWLGENRYEVAGEIREVFFVAPEPHSGGTQDDMLTEIQVPVRKAA